jgi:hypothetical protein
MGTDKFGRHFTARTVPSRDGKLTVISGDQLATMVRSTRTRTDTTTVDGTIVGRCRLVVPAGRHAAVQAEYCHVPALAWQRRVPSEYSGPNSLGTGHLWYKMIQDPEATVYCRVQRLY